MILKKPHKTKYQKCNRKHNVKSKKTRKKTRNYTTMKGGKYISKGSFGCVVRPAIPCKSSKADKANSLRIAANPDNYVSKLIRAPDYHLDSEINIANVLRRGDPSGRYFISIVDTCRLDNIPNNRTNIAKATFYGEKKDEFTITNNRAEISKDTSCPIDLAKNPVNIIMPFGGYDLDKVIRYKKPDNPSSKMEKLVNVFIGDLNKYVKHLVLGVVIMHNNRVVHRDIKHGNILLHLDKNSGKNLHVRYTDFGLSEFLTTNYVTNYENIRLRGTPQYYAPELIAVKTIYQEWNNINNVEYVKNKFFVNSDESSIKKLVKVLEDEKLYNNYLSTRGELFDSIKKLFDDKKILPIYFGTENNKSNGYLQKGDVYALGATIYQTLLEHRKYNDTTYTIDPSLKDLLYKMLDMNPRTRYNAVECLNHPYLASIKSSSV